MEHKTLMQNELSQWLKRCDDLSYQGHNRKAATLLADEEKAEQILKEAFLLDLEPEQAIRSLKNYRVFELFDEFGRTPTNDQKEITTSFLNFPAGTHKDDIWQWFMDTHPTLNRIMAILNYEPKRN